jgi:DNA-binding XRE family transcriptional regulator
MPRVSLDEKLRKARADDWRYFRTKNMLTQRRLADILGISRRTVQQIEGGHIDPHSKTLRLFEAFKRKYDINAEISALELSNGHFRNG